MRDVIPPTRGVLAAALGSHVVVFDPERSTTHVLEGGALAWILGLTQPTAATTVAADVAAATGVSLMDARRAIDAGADLLASLGLLGQPDLVVPEPWPGSELPGDERTLGAVHPVIGRVMAFRSSDPGLLAELDSLFGPGDTEAVASIFIDAEPVAGGGVTVTAANRWDFPARADCLAQIVNVTNEYASRSNDMVVLHAGGVRTPSGEVWLIPGAIDAGKSTLVGALVQAGCDYLGDESIGVSGGSLAAFGYPKPLSLNPASRSVLGLPFTDYPYVRVSELRPAAVSVAHVGPVARVVLPRYRPDQPESTAVLEPVAALRALLDNTLNLLRSGDEGLQALCDLAVSVPVMAISHHDAPALARRLLSDHI